MEGWTPHFHGFILFAAGLPPSYLKGCLLGLGDPLPRTIWDMTQRASGCRAETAKTGTTPCMRRSIYLMPQWPF